MRRVLAYFAWKIDWWRSVAQNINGDTVARNGCLAYAEKQISIFKVLSLKFRDLWIHTAEDIDVINSLKL